MIWLRRLLKTNAQFVELFELTTGSLEKIFKTGPMWLKSLSVNPFWNDVISAWIKVTSVLEIKTFLDILNSPI